MKSFTALAALCAALPLVAGHGFISAVVIDGTKYSGNVPNNYQGPSPIRLVSDIGPVKGASNDDLFCGLSAKPAELVVPANSGSTVSFQWSGGAGQKWPHNTGPLMTYMASCGDTTCDKFDSRDAQWFKIDQAGKKSDGTTWIQQDIMNGDAFTIKLPENLTSGDYLIRHEIIALHLAVTEGGAEFYPSCTQVRVGGSGSGQPNATVTFPGAYKDTDPGIFDPTVFNPGDDYVFPGPALSNLAGTLVGTTDAITGAASFPSGSATATASASGSASTKAASTATTTAGSTGSTAVTGGASTTKSQCKLKKRAAASVSAEDLAVVRPRHLSRVMARMLHGAHGLSS